MSLLVVAYDLLVKMVDMEIDFELENTLHTVVAVVVDVADKPAADLMAPSAAGLEAVLGLYVAVGVVVGVDVVEDELVFGLDCIALDFGVLEVDHVPAIQLDLNLFVF